MIRRRGMHCPPDKTLSLTTPSPADSSVTSAEDFWLQQSRGTINAAALAARVTNSTTRPSACGNLVVRPTGAFGPDRATPRGSTKPLVKVRDHRELRSAHVNIRRPTAS